MKKMLAILLSMLVSATAFASYAQTAPNGCKVIVIALVKVKPGTEEIFKQNALSILRPTRMEHGNRVYTFNQSMDDKTVFDTFEMWDSVDHLQTHLSTPHMKSFFSQVGGLFESGYPVIHTLQNIECR